MRRRQLSETTMAVSHMINLCKHTDSIGHKSWKMSLPSLVNKSLYENSEEAFSDNEEKFTYQTGVRASPNKTQTADTFTCVPHKSLEIGFQFIFVQ